MYPPLSELTSGSTGRAGRPLVPSPAEAVVGTERTLRGLSTGGGGLFTTSELLLRVTALRGRAEGTSAEEVSV